MTFHLDARCKEMLHTMVFGNGYIKIQTLADQMNISKRSAYYDIQKINEWLVSQGVDELIQERGKGIMVDSQQREAIQTLLFQQPHADYPFFKPEQRHHIEICMTILRYQKLFIEDFMTICDVSRNTVINDLKSVTSLLNKYGLNLVYSMKTGYMVDGDPIRKRAVFFLLFNGLWDTFSSCVFNEEEKKNIQSNLMKLKTIEDHLDAEYVSETLPALATFLVFLGNQKDSVSFDELDEDEIKDTQEYSEVNQIFSTLEESEKIYLSLHLLGSRLQAVPMQVMKDNPKTKTIAEQLVQSFERVSGIQYQEKTEIIQAITAHLMTSMYRFKYGIQLGNPLLESIKNEYSELFELTKKALKDVQGELGIDISDAEIAYLTLHFGAFLTPSDQTDSTYKILIICPNGIGTGNMLKKEVSSLVPQATEIQNIPLSGYKSDHDYDVVISTVVLPEEKKLIVVHPILTDQDRVAILRKCIYSEPNSKMEVEDIIKIASRYIDPQHLGEFRQDLASYYSSLRVNKAPQKEYGMGLKAYLTKNHIQTCPEDIHWEAAIRMACQPLLDDDSITQEYIEAIITDQKERGLYMFLTEGLVLAHSSSEHGVKQVDVSLATFSKPVLFENQREARIIIALCAEDQTKHIRILNDILKIFSKKKNVEKIGSMESSDEIYAYINEQLKEENA